MLTVEDIALLTGKHPRFIKELIKKGVAWGDFVGNGSYIIYLQKAREYFGFFEVDEFLKRKEAKNDRENIFATLRK